MLIYKNPFNVLLFNLWQFLCHVKCQKQVNLLSPDGFFQPQNTLKLVFGWGSAPNAGGGELTTLPQTHSRLGRWTPPPHYSSTSTPLASRSGLSLLQPPPSISVLKPGLHISIHALCYRRQLSCVRISFDVCGSSVFYGRINCLLRLAQERDVVIRSNRLRCHSGRAGGASVAPPC